MSPEAGGWTLTSWVLWALASLLESQEACRYQFCHLILLAGWFFPLNSILSHTRQDEAPGH